MTPGGWLGWGIALAAGLYGLHRLALRLERRGWIYYRNRPSSGAPSVFAPLQELIEPRAEHVRHVLDERRSVEEEAPCGDRPPDDDARLSSGGGRPAGRP